MTNEEKAGQISGRILGFRDIKTQEIFNACMEMAKFKDEKIKNLLILISPYIDKDILYKAKEIAFN